MDEEDISIKKMTLKQKDCGESKEHGLDHQLG